jgi:hypothetical protein
MELVHHPATQIEPNDLLDYSLNCGHRHRFLEGWEIKDGKQHAVGFNANDYPERLFFYTLAKRAVDEVYQSISPGAAAPSKSQSSASPAELKADLNELKADLKRFLRKEYRLLDPKLQPAWDIMQTVQYWGGQQQQLCQQLDQEQATSPWAARLYTLQTLERTARQLAMDIPIRAVGDTDLLTALIERGIHLPPEQYNNQKCPLPGLLRMAALRFQDNARLAVVWLEGSRRVTSMLRRVQQLDKHLR